MKSGRSEELLVDIIPLQIIFKANQLVTTTKNLIDTLAVFILRQLLEFLKGLELIDIQIVQTLHLELFLSQSTGLIKTYCFYSPCCVRVVPQIVPDPFLP